MEDWGRGQRGEVSRGNVTWWWRARGKKKRKKNQYQKFTKHEGKEKSKKKIKSRAKLHLAFQTREIQIKTQTGEFYSPATWLAQLLYCLWTRRANQPVAEQQLSAWRRGEDDSQMRKKKWWIWVVGVSQTAADLLGFSQHRNILWDFKHNGHGWGKHLPSGRCVHGKYLVDVRGQRSKVKGSEWARRPQKQQQQCEPNKVTNGNTVLFKVFFFF